MREYAASRWVVVAQATDLLPQSARVVQAGEVEVALIRTATGFFALDNACPHTGGPLGEGLVQGNIVTCPLHGWQFDCTTGACLTEKGQRQKGYAVKIDQEQVWVEVPAATQPAVAETWMAVAEASELRPGTVRPVQVGAMNIALICTTDGIHALDNTCAHEGGPLGEGSVEGTTITCPLHGWQFNSRTGRCLTEKGQRQHTFATKVEQGKVWVQVASSTTVAKPAEGPAGKKSRVEIWKTAKHGIDVWPDILRYAQEGTPMAAIDDPDLERMKWYGYFYRKNNDNNHYQGLRG